MPTTFQVDDSLAEEFRNAVEDKYGKMYGCVGKEIKAAIEERIKLLKSKEYNPATTKGMPAEQVIEGVFDKETCDKIIASKR